MPFRIPVDYETLMVYGSDPARATLEAYILWLRREQIAATAALEALVTASPAKKENKT